MNNKDVKLASQIIVSSNYIGGVAGEIVGSAFKEASTIQQNLLTILPDIDFQMSLRKIEYANGRQNFSCGWTPAGAVTLSEKLLTPKKIMNQLEICKEELRQIWSSASMGFSAHNDNMPADVEQALLTEILADLAEAVDNQIWNGDEDNDGEFDGFAELFAADGSVIKAGSGITSLNGAITKANAVAETEKVLNAIPVALRKKSDLVVALSSNWANFLNQAMISAGISNGFGGDDFVLRYGVYNFEIIDGLADNTMVAYQKKNLYFGTGLMSDFNEIRISPDNERLDNSVRYSMNYTAGVQYVQSDEVVWYLSTT